MTTKRTASEDEDRAQQLSHGQRAAVAIAVALGMAVAAHGLAGSYVTVGRTTGSAFAGLIPVGIDGGVLAVARLFADVGVIAIVSLISP